MILLRFLAISPLLSATLLAASTIENRSSLSEPTSILIPSEDGSISAIVREQRFSVRSNSGRLTNRNALLVMLPERRLYWLGYKEIGIGDRRQFFALGEHIVGVSTYSGDILNFYVSSEPMPSGNSDTFAHRAFEERFSKFNSRNCDNNEVSFRMENVLGMFPFEQVSASGEPAPEITKISVTTGAFTLTFRGGEKNDIEVTITFGSDFLPISATLKGKKVFPKGPTASPSWY